MAIVPIQGKPGSFLDEETGQIITLVDYVEAPAPRCKVCDKLSVQWSSKHYGVCLRCAAKMRKKKRK